MNKNHIKKGSIITVKHTVQDNSGMIFCPGMIAEVINPQAPKVRIMPKSEISDGLGYRIHARVVGTTHNYVSINYINAQTIKQFDKNRRLTQ